MFFIKNNKYLYRYIWLSYQALISSIFIKIFWNLLTIQQLKLINYLNHIMSQQTQQAAIGIDIGSWRSVIAVAKRGGIEVITN